MYDVYMSVSDLLQDLAEDENQREIQALGPRNKRVNLRIQLLGEENRYEGDGRNPA